MLNEQQYYLFGQIQNTNKLFNLHFSMIHLIFLANYFLSFGLVIGL